MLAAEIRTRCPSHHQRPARGRREAFAGRHGHRLLGSKMIITRRRCRTQAIGFGRAGHHIRTRHSTAILHRPDRHHLGGIGQVLARLATFILHGDKCAAHLLKPGGIRTNGRDHHGNRAEPTGNWRLTARKMRVAFAIGRAAGGRDSTGRDGGRSGSTKGEGGGTASAASSDIDPSGAFASAVCSGGALAQATSSSVMLSIIRRITCPSLLPKAPSCREMPARQGRPAREPPFTR